MAGEQSLLGLFDSDSNSFLDELTPEPGGNGLGGTLSLADSLMDPTTMSVTQPTPAVLPGVPPQQQGYNQMGVPARQQQQQYNEFNQFGSPKQFGLNEGANMNVAGGMNQGQHMMSPSQQQQQQFGSPPSSGHMTQSPSYQSYNMHNSPRLTPPRQNQPQSMAVTQGMNQSNMWNQNVNMPNSYIQNQQQQQQQQQQQHASHGTATAPSYNNMASQGNYLSHHDYALPPSHPNAATQGTPQRMGSFPEQQGLQTNSYGPPTMGSPPPNNRLGHIGMTGASNALVRMNQQQGARMMGNYPPSSQQQVGIMGQGNINMSTNYSQTRRQQGFTEEPMAQQQAMNSGPQLNGNKIQHFSYPQQQNPQNLIHPQTISDAPPLSHFPQSPTPNQNQYCPPYGGNALAPRPATSPRPNLMTPPPPSHTPTAPTPHLVVPPNSQGNYQQSSLQQLEQLVPQQGNIGAVSSAYMQQNVQANAYSNAGMNQMPNTVGQFSNANIMQTNGSNQVSMPVQGLSTNTNMSVQMSQPMSQASPNYPMSQNQQAVNVEIQQLQHQIQQLYSMQQTPQTQQKMLDLQERMRTLKAQQQQAILQQQRIQQQQMMHQKMQQQPGIGMQPQMTPGQSRMVSLVPQSQSSPLQQNQFGQQQTQQPRAPMRMPTPQQQPNFAQQIQIQQQPNQIQIRMKEPSASPQVPTPPMILPTSTPQQQMNPQQQTQKIVVVSIQQPLQQQQIGDAAMESQSTEFLTMEDHDKMGKAKQAQEKANQIVAEAIAKARAEGKDVPGQVLPTTLEGESAMEDLDGKGKKKGKKKATGEKKPRTPRTKTGSSKSKKKKEAGDEGAEMKEGDKSLDVDASEDKSKADKKQKTPKIALKPKSSKKKKPPATFLLNKKKRKRNDSGSDVEHQITPPHSPSVDDSLIEKRRSARNTKRKKYHDDLDLNLSDDEMEKGDGDVVVKPVQLSQFFVENPTEDDAQIVEKILAVRMGRRTQVKIKMVPVKKQLNESVDVDIIGDEDKSKQASEQVKSDVTGSTGANGDIKVLVKCVTDTEEKDEHLRVNITQASDEKKEEEMMEEEEEEEEEIEVEEFYVKYKNFSYLHCEWKTALELEWGDRRIGQKIKRYRLKKLQNNTYFSEMDEDDMFNPDYIEVDRVLDESVITDPVTNETVRHYLVKWRSLPYEDSTWELEQDVDNVKIENFKRFRIPPPEDDRVEHARPTSKQWKKLETSKVYKNGNILRDYQLEGINWLTFCWYNKQNCILADEMGLGKTIQSLTFLQEAYTYGIRGPFLIIAPLSTIANWQREFETWVDLNVITYHGTTPSRVMIQKYEMYHTDENGERIPDCYKFHALITTYEIVISDFEVLSQIEWRILIIDEAHRLKNRSCKLMEGLNHFELEHKVLLTGTPLQNNVDELFSLLHFLEPKQFHSNQEFMLEFGDLKSDAQVTKLKAVLKPMMLRRLKEDVEKTLAPKTETIIEVELTNIQKKYYRAIVEKNFTFLSKGGSTANMPNLMNTMMELRKCCNHPYLINGAEEATVEEVKAVHGPNPEKIFEAMVQASGKLVLVDKLLPKLKAGDHKVLIFSQMIRVLDILEDYLIHKRYLYERLDGRIRGNIRQEAIDRFSKKDSDRFVFLLCTRAGGLGINLTAADTCIIFDSDWNPQNDLQAQARCHRIGQTKDVKIYRLITRNSYEREMFDRASLKLGLDKAVLQSLNNTKDQTNSANALGKKEIEDLLKRGAYGALMDDDSAADQFCEEDIDQILQRRTKVITLEHGEKGGTFAKASFSASDTRCDIDIDDPNFWSKWAKKADFDVEDLQNKNELIIEIPRKRKQTARYGNQKFLEDVSDLESSDSEEEFTEHGSTSGRGRGRRRGGGGGKVSGRGTGRKGRRSRYDEDFDMSEPPEGLYTRGECFKVEKHLLVYGWGRWDDILSHGRFKRRLNVQDVETITKALLLYSLKHYKGDERIKGFIWDLVTNTSDDGQGFRNHSGLSAPVPRGRKGKKNKERALAMAGNDSPFAQEMAKLDFNPESILMDEGYKKHLQRHSNKVLLRVRLLYYLKQEVIGDQASKVFQGYPMYSIDFPLPLIEGEPPTLWWDDDADKSLLIGVFKHGYEKYNMMRQDPSLVFLTRCGPPDQRAIAAEMNDEADDTIKDDDADRLDDEDIVDSPASSRSQSAVDQIVEGGKLIFPSTSDLNTRLRRIITGYQRNHKKEMMKNEQEAKKMERRQKFELIIQERERQKREAQQNRWSRREEADFYRVVSTFGVERDRHTKQFKWNTFRRLARLDKKLGDTLTEYFVAFYHMCKRVCKRFQSPEEAIPPNTLYVEPITEERASRSLARIDLLNKIREEILWHPKLDERSKLCQTTADMPDWWEPGKHDKELLIGAAKHGLSRTDLNILHDPKLIFQDIVRSLAHAKNIPEHSQVESVISQDSEKSGPPPTLKQEEDLNVKEAMNKVKQELEKVKKEQEAEEMKEAAISKLEDSVDQLVMADKAAKAKNETGQEKVKNENGEVTYNEGQIEHKDLKKNELPVKDTKVKETVNEEDNELVKHSEKVKVENDSEVMDELDGRVKDEQDGKVKEEKDVEMEDEKEGMVKDETDNGEKDMLEKEVGLPKELKRIHELQRERKDSEDTDDTDELGSRGAEEGPLALLQRNLVNKVGGYFSEIETPGDDSNQDYDLEQTEALAKHLYNPAIQWPKDKVIFHRLEAVCHCIEKGEWTLSRKFRLPVDADSRSSTPALGTPSSTPRPEVNHDYILSTPDSGYKVRGDYLYSGGVDSEVENGEVLTLEEAERNFKVHLAEGEGLKMTFQKKRRGRRKKEEVEAERAMRMCELMAVSLSDGDSESNAVMLNGSGQQAQEYSPLQKDTDITPEKNSYHLLGLTEGMRLPQNLQAMMSPDNIMKKKRGRKRKIDKLLEAEAAAAAAGQPINVTAAPEQQGHIATKAPLVLPPNPEERVRMINLEDGSILSGEEAPKRKDLEKWMEENPGFVTEASAMEPVDVEEEINMALHKGGRKRRPRLDPYKLDLDNLTGEENVTVIHRETGKKITGAKAPPLMHLAEWLEQNSGFDVEAKWSHVVSAGANLPERLQSRVLKPSGRGRKPNNVLAAQQRAAAMDYNSLQASMSSYANLASAGLLGNYGKLPVGFGAIPGLGYNPMYAASLAGFGMIPGMAKAAAAAAATSSSGDEEKEKEKKGDREEVSDEKKKDVAIRLSSKDSPEKSYSTSASTPTPHPSFPVMYNPMMFNPLFAQSLAGNFTLPTGIPTSFASLAHAQSQLLNGVKEPDHESQVKRKPTSDKKLVREAVQMEVQDLSMKSTTAEDLSVKKPSKDHSDKKGSNKSQKDRLTKSGTGDQPVDLVKKKEQKRGLADIVHRLKDKPKKGLADIVNKLKEKPKEVKESRGGEDKDDSSLHIINKSESVSVESEVENTVLQMNKKYLSALESRTEAESRADANSPSLESTTPEKVGGATQSQDQKDKCDSAAVVPDSAKS